jgi:hypothetical protein
MVFTGCWNSTANASMAHLSKTCGAIEVSQAGVGPPGQAIKDGRADPSDLKRYREASFQRGGAKREPGRAKQVRNGWVKYRKKRFDGTGSTAPSRGKEASHLFLSARSAPPGQALQVHQ